jgi:hypothetical protein
MRGTALKALAVPFVRGCRIWWGDLYRLVSGRGGEADA